MRTVVIFGLFSGSFRHLLSRHRKIFLLSHFPRNLPRKAESVYGWGMGKVFKFVLFWVGGPLACLTLVANFIKAPKNWIIVMEWLPYNTPAWVIDDPARVVLGLGALAYLVFLACLIFLKIKHTPFSKRKKIKPARNSEYVTLEEAATIAFEDAEGTRTELYARWTDNSDSLGYFKQAFLIRKVPILAKSPPSRIPREIPSDLERVWRIIGSDLWALSENEPRYVDCQIKMEDLQKFIREYRDEE